MSRPLHSLALSTVLAALLACASHAGETPAPARTEHVQAVVKRIASGRMEADFSALGRDFRLRLAPNPRLAQWAAGSRWQQYAGSLEGVTGSWVRLAVAGDSLRGVIFDGRELVLVEPGEGGATRITRLADAGGGREISLRGDSVPAITGADVLQPFAGPRVEGLVEQRKLEVSAIGDASFRARYASEAEARDAMLTRLNVVDGIFSAQVGAGVEVTSINLGDALADSLDATTDPPILLDSLGRLRQQTPELHERGLTHLFTGRNLDADNVGIAYSGTLCSQRYSASLTQAHDSAGLDGLISAHEIGHVFGAPHDGDGECAATSATEFIMAPVLNSRATSFSQCSLERMAPRATSASCLRALLPPDMALPASLGQQAAAIGANFNWSIEVENRGERIASNARVTVELTPALTMVSATAGGGTCVVQTSLATCDLAAVNGGDSVRLQFSMRSASAGSFTAHAQVVTPDDGDRSNDASEGSLEVQATAPPPPPAPAPPNSSGGGSLDATMLGALAGLLGTLAWRRRRPAPQPARVLRTARGART